MDIMGRRRQTVTGENRFLIGHYRDIPASTLQIMRGEAATHSASILATISGPRNFNPFSFGQYRIAADGQSAVFAYDDPSLGVLKKWTAPSTITTIATPPAGVDSFYVLGDATPDLSIVVGEVLITDVGFGYTTSAFLWDTGTVVDLSSHGTNRLLVSANLGGNMWATDFSGGSNAQGHYNYPGNLWVDYDFYNFGVTGTAAFPQVGSQDGVFTAGAAYDPFAQLVDIFRYSVAGGLESLGPRPIGVSLGDASSDWNDVKGMSADGSIIVGNYHAFTPITFVETVYAWIWTAATGMQVWDSSGRVISCLSPDGLCIGGWHFDDSGAFTWTLAGGFVEWPEFEIIHQITDIY